MDYLSPSDSIKRLEPVLDEYLRWFLRVSNCIFYPESSSISPATPDMFPNWLKEQAAEKILAPEAMTRVERIHNDLVTESNKLLEKVSTAAKRPEQSEYQHLATIFDEFVKSLWRIEQDCMMDGYGLDPVTGLRNEKMVIKEVNEEINRVKRHGRNFCVALVKIDNFDIGKMSKDSSEEGKLKTTAQMIKKCLRSFDDAYRLENGMFLLSLKQTELFGGLKAIERLKELLEEKKLQTDTKKLSPITLSCCVAQPIRFDEASALIKDLRKFLDSHKNEEGVLLKFYEVTPVQKFLQEEHEA